jgi:hypothetical protein
MVEPHEISAAMTFDLLQGDSPDQARHDPPLRHRRHPPVAELVITGLVEAITSESIESARAA